MINDDDKPRQIAQRFRASLDPNDPAGLALLAANDEKQAEWQKRVNSPFAHKSPRDLFRAKAQIRIDALSNPALVLTDDQKESLAEAHAALGRFDLAAEISVANKEHYERYWNALAREDNETCEHPTDIHGYIKEWVWSIKHGCEVALVACNIPECGDWQIAPAPDTLQQRHDAQKSIQGSTVGMTIEQSQAWHQRNVR